MPQIQEEQLVREATRIFLRLNQAPDDPVLIASREDFLARGAAERATYDEVARAWAITGRRRRPNALLGIVFLLVIGASLYAGLGPNRAFWMSDIHSAEIPEEAVLASGDLAVLDAGTALIDETDGTERTVEVLEGAAFFEVARDTRPFIVQAGEFEARVLGTAFETLRTDDGIVVAVSEGRVEVTDGSDSVILSAGDKLRWSRGSAATVTEVDVASVAAWRGDRLIADGLSFSEAAEIIDRRLPGPILILDAALANARVSGGLDLDRPELALEALAAAEAARVVSLGPLLTLVLSAP